MAQTPYNGPLHEMAATTPTQYLNDSCSVEELNYAIARGSIGATSNPVIVGNVLKKEMHLWRERIASVIGAHPTASETKIAWMIYEALAVNGAKLMLPVHERTGGKLGRLSIQTDPAAYNDPQAILQLFCGDGGNEGQVARAKDGMWIYLFTPVGDTLRSEKLVNMKHHNYRLEPNVHFSPDGKWIIFRANFEGVENVYAVKLRRES